MITATWYSSGSKIRNWLTTLPNRADALWKKNQDGGGDFQCADEITSMRLHAEGGEQFFFYFGTAQFQITGPCEEAGDEEPEDQSEDLR